MYHFCLCLHCNAVDEPFSSCGGRYQHFQNMSRFVLEADLSGLGSSTLLASRLRLPCALVTRWVHSCSSSAPDAPETVCVDLQAHFRIWC